MDAQAEAWRFGRFTLRPGRRLLLADGQPVALSSRAYDMLELLVRCHDRIVTRDEIIAHVWRGTVVGENNLTVQMSNLRRALGDHAGGEPLIVNLPGRGYRLVAEVTEDRPPCAPPPEPTPLAPATPPPGRSRRWRWLVGSAGVSLVLLLPMMAGAPALQRLISGSVRDMRLSVAVHRFAAIGDDPRATALSARCTEAVLARFTNFEDLGLFVDLSSEKPLTAAHFQLTGTVQVMGAQAVVAVDLTETDSGRLLFQQNETLPVPATVAQDSAMAMDLLVQLRPVLFQAEAARRHGPPRDARDLEIAAQVALGESQRITQLQQALAFAEQAVQRNAYDRPARVLLALLLTLDMLSHSARLGDAEGERALALIDEVIREKPHNLLYICDRAYILGALGRLDEAQATAELGLRMAPEYSLLQARLGEILMLKGDIAGAQKLLTPDPNDNQDDTLASIAFADGRYDEAAALSRRDVAATPGDWYTHYPMLLEVAALSQLGRTKEAKAKLAMVREILPPVMRSIGAQRRTAYDLPDPAWQHFKQGLAEAGMPP